MDLLQKIGHIRTKIQPLNQGGISIINDLSLINENCSIDEAKQIAKHLESEGLITYQIASKGQEINIFKQQVIINVTSPNYVNIQKKKDFILNVIDTFPKGVISIAEELAKQNIECTVGEARVINDDIKGKRTVNSQIQRGDYRIYF